MPETTYRRYESLRWDYLHGEVFDWWRDDCPSCHEPLRYRITYRASLGFDAKHPMLGSWIHDCGHELLIWTDDHMPPAHMSTQDGSVFVGVIVMAGFWTTIGAVLFIMFAGFEAMESHPTPEHVAGPLLAAFACLCVTAFAAIVAFANWRRRP